MEFSTFGKKFTAQSATVSLMEDLGEALLVNPDLLFMGGGNPARIEEAETIFAEALQKLTGNQQRLHKMLGVYAPPAGDPEFLNSLAAYLNRHCGWQISAKNIAITNGSQKAFSTLFNLFAGDFENGKKKSVHLPVVPEYVGYADVGLSENFFTATKPSLEYIDDLVFKYHVDFNNLSIDDSKGMLCVSRPTNPTGNVLTDDEIEHLLQIAKKRSIPLVIDGAYGTPFPNIIFTQAKAIWDDQIIFVLSLSKLGLPGVRTGIVLAHEDIIAAVNKVNTIMCLASGNLGPAFAKELLETNQLQPLCENVVQPFYRHASGQAVQWVKELFIGLPCRLHAPEGAIFLWLWFEGLPITSAELYQRLKARGVLVLAGEDFFMGLDEPWQHRYECIRVTYCQPASVVRQGLEIIAEEVAAVFAAT